MPTSPLGSLSPAGADLGLGDLLGQQVQGETEEQRRKRMAEMQQQRFGGMGTMGGSLATMSLFGGGLGGLARRQ